MASRAHPTLGVSTLCSLTGQKVYKVYGHLQEHLRDLQGHLQDLQDHLQDLQKPTRKLQESYKNLQKSITIYKNPRIPRESALLYRFPGV